MPAGHKFQRHFGWRHFFPPIQPRPDPDVDTARCLYPRGFTPQDQGFIPITEQARNQRNQVQVSQVLVARRSPMMSRIQLTSWMNPRLWRWGNLTPVSAPRIHGSHQGPWLVLQIPFRFRERGDYEGFPKPNCEALTVPKLDQEVKEQLKRKGKDPFFGGEKSLYKIQEQLLDAAGPLTCLRSDLLNNQETRGREGLNQGYQPR